MPRALSRGFQGYRLRKTLTSYRGNGIPDEIKAAEGIYLDKDVVIDKNFITSRWPIGYPGIHAGSNADDQVIFTMCVAVQCRCSHERIMTTYGWRLHAPRTPTFDT